MKNSYLSFKSFRINFSRYSLVSTLFFKQWMRNSCHVSSSMLILVFFLPISLRKGILVYKIVGLKVFTPKVFKYTVFTAIPSYLYWRVKTMKNTLSPTSLNLFAQCPTCFWHERKGLKKPKTPFPSLPNGLDRTIKTYFDRFRAECKLPPELQTLKDFLLFPDQTRLDYWRNNFKGLTYTDKNGFTLRGAIDELLIKGQKKIILDFKTKSSPPGTDSSKYYELQLSLYTFLLLQNGYQVTNTAFLLYYYPVQANGSLIQFQTQLVPVRIDVLEAQRIFEAAIQTLQQPQPPNNPNCQYCQYRK